MQIYGIQKILLDIHAKMAEVGRELILSDFPLTSGLSARTVQRRFGSISKACSTESNIQLIPRRDRLVRIAGEYNEACQLTEDELIDWTNRPPHKTIYTEMLGIPDENIYPENFSYDFWDEELGNVQIFHSNNNIFDVRSDYDPDTYVLIHGNQLTIYPNSYICRRQFITVDP